MSFALKKFDVSEFENMSDYQKVSNYYKGGFEDDDLGYLFACSAAGIPSQYYVQVLEAKRRIDSAISDAVFLRSSYTDFVHDFNKEEESTLMYDFLDELDDDLKVPSGYEMDYEFKDRVDEKSVDLTFSVDGPPTDAVACFKVVDDVVPLVIGSIADFKKDPNPIKNLDGEYGRENAGSNTDVDGVPRRNLKLEGLDFKWRVDQRQKQCVIEHFWGDNGGFVHHLACTLVNGRKEDWSRDNGLDVDGFRYSPTCEVSYKSFLEDDWIVRVGTHFLCYLEPGLLLDDIVERFLLLASYGSSMLVVQAGIFTRFMKELSFCNDGVGKVCYAIPFEGGLFGYDVLFKTLVQYMPCATIEPILRVKRAMALERRVQCFSYVFLPKPAKCLTIYTVSINFIYDMFKRVYGRSFLKYLAVLGFSAGYGNPYNGWQTVNRSITDYHSDVLYNTIGRSLSNDEYELVARVVLRFGEKVGDIIRSKWGKETTFVKDPLGHYYEWESTGCFRAGEDTLKCYDYVRSVKVRIRTTSVTNVHHMIALRYEWMARSGLVYNPKGLSSFMSTKFCSIRNMVHDIVKETPRYLWDILLILNGGLKIVDRVNMDYLKDILSFMCFYGFIKIEGGRATKVCRPVVKHEIEFDLSGG